MTIQTAALLQTFQVQAQQQTSCGPFLADQYWSSVEEAERYILCDPSKGKLMVKREFIILEFILTSYANIIV